MPKWLKEAHDLNDVAKRRCLMVLDVLSGARPVSDAIEEAKISRGLYYQLETKAVRGMLHALSPAADTSQPVGLTEKLKSLTERVRRLECEKRRLERLLYITKQVVRSGPIALGPGRPLRSSTRNGKKPSASSTTKPMPATSGPSTPTTAGAGARSPGNGN
jgi:hypothetical protein